MKKIIKRGLTFDDVLLVPKKSNIYSRKNVSLKTKLTKNIILNNPIVSSNMDTVTESKMAIAMARKGGIGIIHRFMPIEDQVYEVLKVKRAESIFLDNPYTLEKNNTVREAISLMENKEISGILIIDSKGKLEGILTSRDVRFEENIDRKISEIMTKNSELISAEYGISLDEAKEILHKYRIEKLPIVDKKGYLIGLITSSDIRKRERFPNACKDKKGRLRVGAAVGVKSDFLDRTEKLIQAGCDTIVVDIAHGHSDLAINAVRRIKNRFETEVIAGNIATAKGTQDLIDAGSDAIKIGIGPGCFAKGTRILMSNGIYKNIEEIKAGERVINKDGNPVKVKKSFSTGIRKVSKLRNSIFYEDTYVTSDHKYWVGDLNSTSKETIRSRGYSKLLNQKSKTIPKASKLKWKKIEDVERDVLLIPNKINFDLKNSFEIKLKKRTSGNYKTGHIYTEDTNLKPNYELGYIFGTFLGDGTSHTAVHKGSHIGSVRWYFGYNEDRIAKKLEKSIEKVFDKRVKIKKEKNMTSVYLFYKPLADYLTKFEKKQNKNLPKELIINNEEYLEGIFDGLIDSDGHIEKNGRIRFNNTSKKLIELFNIVHFILKGVFPNNLKKKISSGNLKANLENFNQGYVADIINIGEKRLIEKYQLSKLLELERNIKEVEVYDLEIDCPTHSFIANNSIVHNSICTTRIVSGAGVPQLSAIIDCASVSRKRKVPLIADGGIRTSGDITKALAAGASTVMLGNVLAGTEESPGITVSRNNGKYKVIRGMASLGASFGRKTRESGENISKNKEFEDITPEGVEALVQYKGNVSEILDSLTRGIQSGFSYCGATNMKELYLNSEFTKISPNTLKESKSHDIKNI